MENVKPDQSVTQSIVNKLTFTYSVDRILSHLAIM